MDQWLKDNLVCPRDYSHLKTEDQKLVCEQGHTYPCVDSIPILLLEEAKPTHGACHKSLEQATLGRATHQGTEETVAWAESVDPYVQRMIAATSGLMYRPLINKLSHYPLPELPLPEGSGEVLLDVGCNWGRWCITAARKGYVPVGMDPSLDAIRAARRVSRQLGVSVVYLVADARHLPFSANTFDAVFSYGVLQHFSKEDARISVAEIGRTLKIHGTSMVQMANSFGARNLYNQFKGRFKQPSVFDVRYWSLSELTSTFSTLIGPSSLHVDAYFGLRARASDVPLLPLWYRGVVWCSEGLCRMSRKARWLEYFADSVYIRSIRAMR